MSTPKSISKKKEASLPLSLPNTKPQLKLTRARKNSSPPPVPTASAFDYLRTKPKSLVQLEFLEWKTDIKQTTQYRLDSNIIVESPLGSISTRITDRFSLCKFLLSLGATLQPPKCKHAFEITLLAKNITPPEEYNEVAKLFLEHGIPPNQVIAAPELTVLDVAFLYGTIEIVQMVVTHYGDKDILYESSVTPCWFVWSLLGLTKKLKKYLHTRKKEGKSVDLNTPHPLLKILEETSHQNRSTPLLSAVAGDHCDLIPILVHYGADITGEKTPSVSLSPLLASGCAYQANMAQKLIDTGAAKIQPSIRPVFLQVFNQYCSFSFGPDRLSALGVLRVLGAHVNYNDCRVDLSKSPQNAPVNDYLLCAFCPDSFDFPRKKLNELRTSKEENLIASYCLRAAVLGDCEELLRIVGVRRASNLQPSESEHNIWYQAAKENSLPILEVLFSEGMLYDVICAKLLLMLIYYNHLVLIQRLIKARPNLSESLNSTSSYFDYQNSDPNLTTQYTPLQLACKLNSLQIVVELLKHGAKPNFVGDHENDCKITPLSLAVKHGGVELVHFLVAAGANVNLVSPRIREPESELSPLQNAIRVANVPAINLLIDRGSEMKRPSALAMFLSDYPTRYTAQECKQFTERFFKAGCAFHDNCTSDNRMFSDYQTRITIALCVACHGASKVLIDHLWAVNILQNVEFLVRAIVLSCHKKHYEIVKYLLDYYFQCRGKITQDADLRPSLQISIRKQQVEVVDLILSSKLVKTENIPLINERLAIDFAIENLNYDLFYVLSKAGAKPSTSSYEFIAREYTHITKRFYDALIDIDATKLLFAVLGNTTDAFHYDMLTLMVDPRVLPNSKNDDGEILSLICYETRQDMTLLKLLLSRDDIDINLSQTEDDRTLLFAACLRGDLVLVKTLIDQFGSKLDVNQFCKRDGLFQVPLYAATKTYVENPSNEDSLEVVRLLMECDIDVDLFSESGDEFITKVGEEIIDLASRPPTQLMDNISSSASAVKPSGRSYSITSAISSSGSTYTRLKRKETPLHEACKHGSVELLDILKKKFSFSTSMDVMTPALYLVQNANHDEVNGEVDFPLLNKYLSGKNSDALFTLSAKQTSALSLAIYRDSVLLVDYLLKRGLDPNQMGRYLEQDKELGHGAALSENNYPLCQAATLGRSFIVDRLLSDERTNIRTTGSGFALNKEGSPLCSAYSSEQYAIVAKILAHYDECNPDQIVHDVLGRNLIPSSSSGGSMTKQKETIFQTLSGAMMKHLNVREDQIPDKFRSTTEGILQYLYDLAQGQQEVRRLRVIIVGPAAAGKTTIVKRLVGEMWNGSKLKHFDEAYEGYKTRHSLSTSKNSKKKKRKGVTDGIDIHFWVPQNENVAIFLWDFAGQEVYYTTHQFFLAPNTLYLIVFNASLPLKHGKIVYWLNSIQSRVKGQQVLIIATHTDKLSKRAQRLQALNDEIANIFKRWSYQFMSSENLIQLVTQEDGSVIWPVAKRESLEHIEAAMIKNAAERKPIPVKYILLRNQVNLLRAKRTPPIIEKHELESLGRSVGISVREQDLALQLLHEWGELMYFPSGWHLGKRIILDPRWLSDVFKTVASFKHSTKSGTYSPVISLVELKGRWRDAGFGPELDMYLIELLEHFQVMVKAPKEVDLYIVPSLLPLDPPEDGWIPLNELSKKKKPSAGEQPIVEEYYREYHLPFTPHGLLSRILAHLFLLNQQGKIDINHYWAYGVVINSPLDKVEAMVKLEDDNTTTFGRVLEVIIRGPDPHWKTKIAYLHSLITGIIADWYPGIRNRLSIFIGRTSLAQSDDDLYFAYEEVLDVYLNGDKAGSNSYGISLPQLLPELTQPIVRWEQGEMEAEDLADSKQKYEHEVQLIKKLGGGMFGHVYKAKWQDKLVAVKTISSEAPTSDEITDFCKEVALLKVLNHPCIVKLLYFFPSPMAIVTELITGGDLETTITTNCASITWDVLAKILLDVARALAFMHSFEPPIYHNDIKVANILVVDLHAKEPDVSVKVADVGCARLANANHDPGQSQDDLSKELSQYIGVMIDLYDVASKGSPCPEPLQQLLYDAKNDKISSPIFANLVKRLEIIYENLHNHTISIRNQMEELQVLQQLEGAVLANQNDVILEILSSQELKLLGKRAQTLTHQIFYDAIMKDDILYFTALLKTGSWGVNNYLDETHTHLVHTVCQKGNVAFLQVLLEYGVDIESLNPTTDQTALHVAVVNNHPDIVQLLLRNFANVDAMDKDRKTPAMLAAELGMVECLEFLLRNSVNPNTGLSKRSLSVKGASLLQIVVSVDAFTEHHTACVKILLEHGAVRPISLSWEQMNIILVCAHELFQQMCFAEPTVARQIAMGMIGLFRSCNTMELQQLQQRLASVHTENRIATLTRVRKLLDKRKGITVKPEIIEQTAPPNATRITFSFTLKSYCTSEVNVILLIPKHHAYKIIPEEVEIFLRPSQSKTISCEIVILSREMFSAIVVAEVEGPNGMEYHYIVVRVFSTKERTISKT